MRKSRLIASILIAFSLIAMVPANAINTGEGTDKYSDTTTKRENRKVTENISDSEKDDDTMKTENYLQTTISPAAIQQTSDIPDGFDSYYSPKGGYGTPVKVTNDVGVYIQRDAPRRVLKGTVIRSINNKCAGDLFTPDLETIPWLKSKVVKDFDFAALYTGEWFLDKTVDNSTTKASDPARIQDGKEFVQTRANKILGGDALVVNELYSPSGGYTSSSIKSGGGMNLRDAITISYKALSDNYYWIQAYTQSQGTKNIPVEQTPFAESVGAENCTVDHTRYYTDIWVSRTCPRTYYGQALRDGITSYAYDDPEAYEHNITIGQFCVIVAKLLDLNGEDVIIDQEAQQLLQVYQRSIPAYTTSVEQDAIKYLMVRGIVDNDTDFTANISGEEALTILMRAKDKSSRLTFKNLEIPYDKDIMAKGFTGIDLQTEDNGIGGIRVERSEAVTEYYDYMIKKNGSTTFKDINGNEVTAIFVSTGDDSNKVRIQGSDYIGEDDGYYHFKIPITATSYTKTLSNVQGVGNVYTITTYNSDNKPTKYYVEEGGGVYNEAVKIEEGENSIAVWKRSPFTATDDTLLVDKNRKESSQLAMNDNDEIKLTSNSYTAWIQIKNKEKTKWAGKKISEITSNESSPQDLGGAKVYCSKYNILVITFENEKNPWEAIAKNLDYDAMASNGDGKDSYPAYIISKETTPTLLVSMSWLRAKQKDLPNPVTDVKPLEDNKYEIGTANGPIQVDTKAKTYAVGSVYTELGQNDSSPMVVKSNNGDYYIDYRVISSSISGFVLFNKDDSKSFIPTGVLDGIKGNSSVDVPQAKPIKSLTGSENDTLTVNALFAKGSKGGEEMLLEGPYAKSNFMIYKLNREGLKGDYLLVFKPSVDEYKDENKDKINQKLSTDFKVKVGGHAVASIYNLDSTVRNADTSTVHTLSSPIENKPGYGYMYKVPDISQFDIKKYYNAVDNSSCPLPIVKYKDKYYDVNTNHVKGFAWDRVPGALLTSDMTDITSGNDLIYSGGFKTDSKKQTFSASSEVIPAPIGLTACYKDEYDKSVKDLLNSTNDSTYRAIGTMGGSLEDTLNSSTYYNFNISNGALNYKVKSSDKFYLAGGDSSIAKNKSKGIYVLKDENGVGITSLDDLNNKEMSLGQGLLRNIFDWKMFTFIEALRTAEDVVTICYIIVLEIMPRIMLFIFLALATLSLLADNNFMRTICYRIVDPYKILSLGMLDVETIDSRKIWLSTLWACVLLALLNVETFTHVFAYFVRAIIGILDR